MRWLFYDQNDPNEAAQHQSVLASIDRWWLEFQSKTDDFEAMFSNRRKWDLPEWMVAHLGAIHPSLMWEFGPALDCDGHRLVITPESDHFLRPLTTTVLQRAPQIARWEFYGYRLPEDLASAQSMVEARTNGDLKDVQVRVKRGDSHRVDLLFVSPRTKHANDEQALNEAFVATETLVGEQCLDQWIGTIEVAPSPKRGLTSLFGLGKPIVGLIPLVRLKETVDSVIGSILDQLPPQSHDQWIEDAQWTLWELQPNKADDYPAQLDLMVGKSANKDFWSAAHGPGLFYSERFSRCGETFCYVKIDGTAGIDWQEFGDKSEIEDALDAVLKEEGLGCHIGGGTGARYSYIDLALTDRTRGLRAVRERLQQGNISRRSWIQFFDSDLSAEWVGIYDDSPPPPMPSGSE